MAKMSNRKFRTIMVPVASLLIALPVIGTITANQYAASLDFAFGKGEKHIVEVEGLTKEDTAYYEHNYADKVASRNAATKVAQEVEEKGAVLLKNNNDVLPLASKAKVTPFGYRYASPIYGGTGSANIDTSDTSWLVTPDAALKKHFTVNETVDNLLLGSKESVVTMEYPDGNDPTNLSEYNSSLYIGSENSCKGTTGIIYIARPGTEGYDLNSTTPYADGTAHQLTLTTYEKSMIEFAKTNCDHVVVLVITPTQFMINDLVNDDKIDAIIWTGLPGASGYEAIANILDGTVNPSGKTSDIWYADFENDPVWKNFTSNPITNAIKGGPTSTLEYEEGLYLGYRYYETKFAEDNKFTVFGSQKGYDEAVNYPFGFGLNYEDDKITQTLTGTSYRNGTITVKGKIENKSSRDVDEVVQIYYGAPYTNGGIEKAAKNLVKFDKINVKAGKSENFEISFDDEDMASYDHKKIYTTTGSYVLEGGDYKIYLGKDSHSSWGEDTIKILDTKVYSKEAKSGTAVGKRLSDKEEVNNLFDELNSYELDGGMTTMSRKDMNGTFPQSAGGRDLAAKYLENIKALDIANDPKLGNVEGSLIYRKEDPTSKAGNNITLSDLRGLDYDDPRWDELLDNLDYESDDIDNAITWALYQTAKIESIGKVETCDNDGTAGLTATWGGNDALAGMFGMTSVKVTACCYPSCPTMAATFDVDIIKKMGEMISEESLTNGLSGWYAPGLNLHRTPFGGRNFEYYSEDPVLSGYMAAAAVSGAFTKGGLYAYLKHFALNETDVNRANVAVWANEQVCRELYFKAFEICVKNARGEISYYDGNKKEKVTKEVNACRGIMTSMNYVGTQSPTNSYTMLTELLRDEWGFEGMVETDFTSGTFKDKQVGYRVGNDLWMAMRKTDLDLSTPTAKWCARNAIHNLCYVVVNSNAYDKVGPGSYAYYDMSKWQMTVLIIDVVFGILAVADIAYVIFRAIKFKDAE